MFHLKKVRELLREYAACRLASFFSLYLNHTFKRIDHLCKSIVRLTKKIHSTIIYLVEEFVAFNKWISDQITGSTENDTGTSLSWRSVQHVTRGISHANNDQNHQPPQKITKKNVINHLQEARKTFWAERTWNQIPKTNHWSLHGSDR